MPNVEFDDGASTNGLYAPEKRGFLSRSLVAWGLARDEREANKILTVVAIVAVLLAVAVLFMFYNPVPGKSTVTSPPVYYDQ